MAAEVEREVLLELVHVAQVASITCGRKCSECRVRSGDVGLVVLGVVQFHDAGADVRLKRRVVV